VPGPAIPPPEVNRPTEGEYSYSLSKNTPDRTSDIRFRDIGRLRTANRKKSPENAKCGRLRLGFCLNVYPNLDGSRLHNKFRNNRAQKCLLVTKKTAGKPLKPFVLRLLIRNQRLKVRFLPRSPFFSVIYTQPDPNGSSFRQEQKSPAFGARRLEAYGRVWHNSRDWSNHNS